MIINQETYIYCELLIFVSNNFSIMSCFDPELLIAEELCRFAKISFHRKREWVAFKFYEYENENHFTTEFFQTKVDAEEDITENYDVNSKNFVMEVAYLLCYESIDDYTMRIWHKIFSSKNSCRQFITEFEKNMVYDGEQLYCLDLTNFKDNAYGDLIIQLCKVCKRYSLNTEHDFDFCIRQNCSERDCNEDWTINDLCWERFERVSDLWGKKEQQEYRIDMKQKFNEISELLDRPGMPRAMATWLDTLKHANNQ